jgi:tRNA-dihydrouridine synthase B
VTVKLRSGQRPGETDGYALSHRLVEEAGVSAIGFHPRSAAVHHKGTPDYDLAAKLVESLPAPVILTGGLRDRDSILAAYEHTGAAAVMLARGSLGNPWLFEELVGGRTEQPSAGEILDELDWMMDAAAEHFGPIRAARWMRKAYPWYTDRLGAGKAAQGSLQATDSLEAARAILAELRPLLHCAAVPA